MAAALVIGVDIGTTATKSVAFSVDGRAVASASVGYPLDEPLPGRAEQDPQLILEAVLATIRAVVEQVGADAVAGLSFSSAMHSLIALDESFAPLTPSITWADARAAGLAERLRGTELGRRLHQRTGTPIHAMSPALKLQWFREEDPATWGAARFWVGIKEWVLWSLSGELVMDHSLASCSGLLDIHLLDWNDEALQLSGVQRAQLPRLVATTAVLPGLRPEVAAATGLPASMRIVAGGGDGPLANLGVGAVRPGVVACSLGTSGALRVAVDRPVVDPDGAVFCYAITEDRWVVGGAINNGGVTLEWVRQTLGDGRWASTVEMLDAAAEVPAGSGGLLMLPYLLSERAPHWDSTARGSYIGLSRAHRPEHLARAAVEGVALQLALVLRSLAAAGLDVTEIRATGGPLKHPLWQQTLADVFGSGIGLLDDAEGSSYGSAILGMVGLGLVESIDVAVAHSPVGTTVQPQAEAVEVYRELLPLFDGLYAALLPTHARLRELGGVLPLGG